MRETTSEPCTSGSARESGVAEGREGGIHHEPTLATRSPRGAPSRPRLPGLAVRPLLASNSSPSSRRALRSASRPCCGQVSAARPGSQASRDPASRRRRFRTSTSPRPPSFKLWAVQLPRLILTLSAFPYPEPPTTFPEPRSHPTTDDMLPHARLSLLVYFCSLLLPSPPSLFHYSLTSLLHPQMRCGAKP